MTTSNSGEDDRAVWFAEALRLARCVHRAADMDNGDKAYSMLCAHLSAVPSVQAASEPIDMVLFCPKCSVQHVDRPEGQFIPGFTAEESTAWCKHHGLWDNPPHRSHLCHGCGHIWRPADVPTNGVQAVKTTGKADSPISAPGAAVAAELPKGIEPGSINYAVLHSFADKNGVSYNKLCAAVHKSLAEPGCAAAPSGGAKGAA